MTIRGYFRGHSAIIKDDNWVYEDTLEPMAEPRPCAACGIKFPYGKPDICLGMLPGVDSACCGHGRTEDAFIIFESGVVIKGFQCPSEL